jgi:hypothetical protein
MDAPSTEAGPLDVVFVGELVDFTSVEHMIDREALYRRLGSPAERRA